MTSRLVLRPIDELRSAAGAVGKGDFNYTLTVPDPGERPRDELAELTGEFDRMAATLRRFMPIWRARCVPRPTTSWCSTTC